jgi:hypothetical protein
MRGTFLLASHCTAVHGVGSMPALSSVGCARVTLFTFTFTVHVSCCASCSLLRCPARPAGQDLTPEDAVKVVDTLRAGGRPRLGSQYRLKVPAATSLAPLCGCQCGYRTIQWYSHYYAT